MYIQFLREASGGLFNDFFMTITYFGNLPIILFLIAVIYWCFDKKLGEYLLVSMSFARIVDAFVKIAACVYRPWVVDPNIPPLEDALPDATGYSFPSGHATSSTVLFAGVLLKKKNIVTSLKVLLVASFLLICFSRLYVGVHSVLDMVFGFIFSLIVLIIVGKVFDKYEDNPNFDLMVLAAGIIFSILLILYSTYKAYPMDYDAAGKLIVDPAKMALESFKNAGFSIGILLSWVIERRFINFSTEGSVDSKIARIIAGLIGLELLYYVIGPNIAPLLGKQVGSFVVYFIFPVYFIAIMPFFIKFFQKRRNDAETA